MTRKRTAWLAGWLFITGALLVNVPYALLISDFEYPDILRKDTGYILTQFDAGGAPLIYTWLAFAWCGSLLLPAMLLLHKLLKREGVPYLVIGTGAGVAGGIAQMLGLLRWVFVVPVLAEAYANTVPEDPQAIAAAMIFKAVHQYGGVVVGEHIGQLFTIVWIVVTSIAMLGSRLFPRWLSWLGWVTAAIYLFAQSELLDTVIPGTYVMDDAGMVGSMLWLLWMLIIGVYLLRVKETQLGGQN